MSAKSDSEHMAECSGCECREASTLRADDSMRLPRGWDRICGRLYCSECAKSWITRAHTVGVAEMVGHSRKDMYSLLREAWDEVTSAANIALRIMFTHDPGPFVKDGKTKLAPLTAEVRKAVYDTCRAAVPQLRTGSLSDVLQRLWGVYQSQRWDILVRHRRAVPALRSPQPLPVRRQDWQLVRTEHQGRQCFGVRFPLGPLVRDERPVFRLALRTRADWDLFERLERDELDRRTLEILGPSPNRPGIIKAKVVYRKRRGERPAARGTLELTTAADSFLIAATAGTDPMRWHANHLRGRIAAHEQFLAEMADNSKHERRRPRRRRRDVRQAYAKRTARHADRVRTFMHTTAAQVAGLAQRRNVATVRAELTDRGYLPSFAWARFQEVLYQKLDERGIALLDVSKEGDADAA